MKEFELEEYGPFPTHDAKSTDNERRIKIKTQYVCYSNKYSNTRRPIELNFGKVHVAKWLRNDFRMGSEQLQKNLRIPSALKWNIPTEQKSSTNVNNSVPLGRSGIIRDIRVVFGF